MSSTVKASDNFGMEGELSIFIRPEGFSDLIPFYREKNRITNIARKHALDLVTGYTAGLQPNPIVEFKVGTGGIAQTLTGAETNLFSPVDSLINPYTGAITFTYPDTPSNMVAEYAFEVATTELNGITLSEVGLFCQNDFYGIPANGKMFNIKLFPAVPKTSAFALVFVWRINFSGAC